MGMKIEGYVLVVWCSGSCELVTRDQMRNQIMYLCADLLSR